MASANALIGLRAETPIHAGTGASTGVVDLPIQREGHTDWPCIFGSALKGALRARAELDCDSASVKAVFGPDPETDQASEHAGALMVGDARLVLLPVRSLTGHFRWVTCPAVLQRLARDSERLGLALGDFAAPLPADDEAVVAAGSRDLFLEELRFSSRAADLSPVIAALTPLVGPDSADELGAQLAVVSDYRFAYLTRHATPVSAHVRIENDTKTVQGGALWYEETLPPETILYAPLSAAPARKPADGGNGQEPAMDAAQILGSVTDTLFAAHPFLQVGANETVGMGWFRVSVNEAKG